LTPGVDSLGDELVVLQPAFDHHDGFVDVVGIRFEETIEQLEVGKRVFDAVERGRVEEIRPGINSGSDGSELLGPNRA
jgi:hypothetical protein